MGPADRPDAGFRQSEVTDLAGFDQLLDRAGDVFDRDVRVDAVLVQQVDVVGAESFQRGVDGLADVPGAAGQSAGPLAVLVGEAELGSDEDLVADRGERFADVFLVGEGP